jgi:transcriptional regulator with XRE-family HTH domain
MIYKSIGLNIVAHRKLLGMSQAECARRANIGIARMSKIERGLSSDEPISSYVKVATALGIQIGDIFKQTAVIIKSKKPEDDKGK